VRLLPGSLTWRTLAVLVGALVLSQATAFWLFEEQILRPRAALATRHFVSHLKSVSAAMQTMDEPQRRAFVARVAEQDGVRIVAVRGSEQMRPAPERPGLQLFRERIRESFGPAADVYVRSGDAVDEPVRPRVLWVKLPTGEREYWVAFPRGRVERDPMNAVVAWTAAGLAIAILATFLIVWRLNRPLGELARAASALGRGRDHAPVPERGPAEIRALARAFNRMKENLRRGERDRATFLAGVSHDLRTPLARLRLDLEMLEGRIDPATQRAMVGDVDDMDAIIDQFVDFARGEVAEPPAPTDLAQLAEACAESAARSGTSLKREIEPVPALMLRPLALQRLIDNLIANAARHAGGDITLRTARVGGDVMLSVLDRGPGIPPAEVERLKQPFTRRDASRSGVSGAGLGLAIADRVAMLHGGRLELLAREGGGLEARLILPTT
jgi:two-component system, OmpR family, osmolarity sensor histidine kinase EnvZ